MIVVKWLDGLRMPASVKRTLETSLKKNNLKTGQFVLSAVMEKLGYDRNSIQKAVLEAYPPRRRNQR